MYCTHLVPHIWFGDLLQLSVLGALSLHIASRRDVNEACLWGTRATTCSCVFVTCAAGSFFPSSAAAASFSARSLSRACATEERCIVRAHSYSRTARTQQTNGADPHVHIQHTPQPSAREPHLFLCSHCRCLHTLQLHTSTHKLGPDPGSQHEGD